jgi:hypothetical protein
MRKALIAVVVLCSSLGCPDNNKSVTGPANFSMAGTWSVTGGCVAPNGGDTPFNITFTQTGNSFTGTYYNTTGSSSWNFAGVVSGSSVGGTVQGTFVYVVDFTHTCTATFSGSYTANQVMTSGPPVTGSTCPFTCQNTVWNFSR